MNFLIKLTYSISHKMQFIKKKITLRVYVEFVICIYFCYKNQCQSVFPFSFIYFRKHILLLAFLYTRNKIVQRETENTTKVFVSFDHTRKNIRYIFCREHEKWEMNFFCRFSVIYKVFCFVKMSATAM